jgi:hypothetical protein
MTVYLVILNLMFAIGLVLILSTTMLAPSRFRSDGRLAAA